MSRRILTNIKLHSKFIILQDHIEQRLDGDLYGGDMLFIPDGETVNLMQWRTGTERASYPEGIAEVFRHSRTEIGETETTAPYDSPGTGYCNTLWLDGHVSPIKETTGEDVHVRWYNGGNGEQSPPWSNPNGDYY